MRLEPGVPFRSPRPALTIDAGLPPGRHRFRLVVVNARGQESQPAEVTVTVLPFRPLPTPVPRPTPIPDPIPIPRPPIR